VSRRCQKQCRQRVDTSPTCRRKCRQRVASSPDCRCRQHASSAVPRRPCRGGQDVAWTARWPAVPSATPPHSCTPAVDAPPSTLTDPLLSVVLQHDSRPPDSHRAMSRSRAAQMAAQSPQRPGTRRAQVDTTTSPQCRTEHEVSLRQLRHWALTVADWDQALMMQTQG